ncbi:MAG: hypothetical protein DWB89_02860 [Candidatus Poseidoniales archaeon]|nr:MAG: hypothetical protein DWB89_02860 [Candidatus Poseidoniales archaeon]
MVEFTFGNKDTTGIAGSCWHFDEKRNVLRSSYSSGVGTIILGTMFGFGAGIIGAFIGAFVGFFLIFALDELTNYTWDIHLYDQILVPVGLGGLEPIAILISIGGIGPFLYQFGQGILYSRGTHVEEINLNTMKIESFLLLKNGKKAFDEDIQSLGRGGLRIKDDGEDFEIKIGQITLTEGLTHHSVAEQKMEIFRRIIDGEESIETDDSWWDDKERKSEEDSVEQPPIFSEFDRQSASVAYFRSPYSQLFFTIPVSIVVIFFGIGFSTGPAEEGGLMMGGFLFLVIAVLAFITLSDKNAGCRISVDIKAATILVENRGIIGEFEETSRIGYQKGDIIQRDYHEWESSSTDSDGHTSTTTHSKSTIELYRNDNRFGRILTLGDRRTVSFNIPFLGSSHQEMAIIQGEVIADACGLEFVADGERFV